MLADQQGKDGQMNKNPEQENMFFNLMAGSIPPRCTSKDGKHRWKSVISPPRFGSGWHEDECKECGIRIGYDTSD